MQAERDLAPVGGRDGAVRGECRGLRLVADALCVELDGDLRVGGRLRRGLVRGRGRGPVCVGIVLVGVEQLDLLPGEALDQEGQGIEPRAQPCEHVSPVAAIRCRGGDLSPVGLRRRAGGRLRATGVDPKCRALSAVGDRGTRRAEREIGLGDMHPCAPLGVPCRLSVKRSYHVIGHGTTDFTQGKDRARSGTTERVRCHHCDRLLAVTQTAARGAKEPPCGRHRAVARFCCGTQAVMMISAAEIAERREERVGATRARAISPVVVSIHSAVISARC